GRRPARVDLPLGFVRRIRFRGGINLGAGRVLNLVDLAVGGRSSVDHAILVDDQCLHLQLGGFEDSRGLPVGRDAVHAGGRAGGGVDIAGVIGGNRPNVGRRCRVERLEGGGQFETAHAADGDARGGALGQLFLTS